MPHTGPRLTTIVVALTLVLPFTARAEQNPAKDYSPPASEQQLPLKMNSAMEELPTIRVGVDSGDLVGRDNRVLQSAVEYIAGLGGGTVEIGPGEFLMGDSLHLRSNVRIQGSGKSTILKKAPGVVVPLAIDGDFGEQQVTVEDGASFEVGQGIAIWDDRAGGFHTTVARITGKKGNTYAINKPLMADCLTRRNAKAGTLFPVISGYDVTGASIRSLTIEGSKETNGYLNGCRGGGIFLCRAFGTVIDRCLVRNYNGDGISFQQSNDVTVTNSVAEGNMHLGLHPGSGSQRATIRKCKARHNGTDGLFLCWRVRHGVFEDNLLEGNGRFGISIGHKDTDNLLKKNLIRGNQSSGIFFRNESVGMAAHRNRLIENRIENNGTKAGTAAIRVRGSTTGLVIEGNIVRDTRADGDRTQTVGLLLEQNVGTVEMSGNQIEAPEPIVDRRSAKK